ncbi:MULTISPECIES: ABC transporter substrate-binding protein [Pseudofrankia]|uniref:ABC transporter substrate-binding protein n=1 Tax=Pseudofrankia TaxID=2994363 RepID=UPI000234C2E9|nr:MULTISPECIES: ABC transporter substrate-binding protein [Pseudofrankia]
MARRHVLPVLLGTTAAGRAKKDHFRTPFGPPADRRRARLVPVLAAASVLLVVVAGCTRSTDETETGGGGSGAPATSAPAAAAAGDFGTEKGICGPGTASKATGRGVTASSITLGTFGDPGSTITPGLGQEFFDVGEAFVAWCNKAGGINGRELVLNKHDGKLTDVAARMIDACQTDFMIVGGGNAVDAPGVQPREECKLGSVPAYGVSPEALNAKLQVRAQPNTAARYPIGGFQSMARLYPDAMKSLGVGGSTLGTLRPQGLRLQEALTQTGYTVADYQELPPLVTNFRPFVEQLKNKGVQGYQPIGLQDPSPLVTAMNDVGLSLKFMIFENQLYDPLTIQAAKATKFPTTYVVIDHIPWELASQSPVTKEAVDLVHATVPNAKLTDFTALSLNAWVLWAKSATACGDDLTVDCVLGKAGAESAWTAGGLYPERNLVAGQQKTTNCYLLMKVTPDGFVYDKDATGPNKGFFNCDDKNVATLANTFTDVSG